MSSVFEASLPFESLVEHLPSALIVVDKRGTICHTNRLARKILNCNIEAGHPLSDYIAPLELLHNTQFSQEQFAQDQNDRGVIPACNPSIELGFGISNLSTADGSYHLFVFRDISSSIRLRKERDRLLRIATLGKAMPTLLHELKNPLAAIITSLELMVEDLGDDSFNEKELADDISALLAESRRLELIIDGVGTVQRPLLSSQYTAIDQLCRDSLSLMKGKARNAGVILTSDIPALPVLPYCPAVIRAIVYNLVSNSIAASRKGEVVSLSASLDVKSMFFELCVSDTGSGMTPGELEKCTTLFYSTKRSGSGIGLALCRRVAEEAGGVMDIKSATGVGTKITIRVPASSDR